MLEVDEELKDSIEGDLEFLATYMANLDIDKKDLIKKYCRVCLASDCDPTCEVYVLIHKIVDALNHV